MVMKKSLIFGVVGSALIGALVTAADVASTMVAQEERTVLVPAGRVGDIAEYSSYSRADGQADWTRGLVLKVRVTNLTLAWDQNVRLHASFGLEYVANETQHPDSRSIVSLETREVVRHDDRYEYSTKNRGWRTFFGPSFGPDVPDLRDAALVWAQGQALRVGDDLSQNLRSAFEANWAVANQTVAFQSTISGSGEIAGTPVLDWRTAGAIHFRTAPEDDFEGRWLGGHGARRFLSGNVPLDSMVAFERHLWLGATAAYPLVIQESVTVNGGHPRENMWILTSVIGGQEALPWGPVPGAPAGTLERSGADKLVPGDGDSGRCYTLDRAIADARGGAAVPGFRAWMAQNPENYLLAASTGECQGGTGTWGLLFAAPGGNAYSLWISNDLQRNLEAQADGVHFLPSGPWTVPPFQPKDLPMNMLTFGAVEKLWREYDFPNVPKTPNRVSWGCEQWRIVRAQPRLGTLLDQCTQPEWLRWMTVGYTATVSTQDAAWTHSTIFIDPDAGRLLGANDGYVAASCYVLECLPGASLLPGSGAKDPAEAQAATLTSPPVEILPGLLVASSLFLGFLAAYYWPLLKGLGGEVVAVLPGYAKLHRAKLLDNRFREGLASAIKEDPGVSAPELQRMLGGGWSTIVYHLGVLERNKLVSSLVDGRHKRYFPADSVDWSKRSQLAVLRDGTSRRLYQEIRAEPGLPQGMLFKRLGLHQASARWHVERLEKAGLIGHDKLGRRVHYYPNDATPRRPDVTPASSMEIA